MNKLVNGLFVILAMCIGQVTFAAEKTPACHNPLYALTPQKPTPSDTIVHSAHFCLHPVNSGKTANVINPIGKFEAWVIAKRFTKTYQSLNDTVDKALFIHHFLNLYSHYHYLEKRPSQLKNSLRISTLITGSVTETGYLPLQLLPDNNPKVFKQLQQTAQHKDYPNISKSINDLVYEVLFVDGKKPPKQPKKHIIAQKALVDKPKKLWDGLTKEQREDKSDCKLKHYLLRGPNVFGNIEDVFYADDFCMREQVRPLNTLVVNPILSRKQAFDIAVKYRKSFFQLNDLGERAMLAHYFLKTLSHDSFVEPVTSPLYLGSRNKLLLPITLPVKSDRNNGNTYIEMNLIPQDEQKKVLSEFSWLTANVTVTDAEPFIKNQVHQVIFGNSPSTPLWVEHIDGKTADDLAIMSNSCWKTKQSTKSQATTTTPFNQALFSDQYCIGQLDLAPTLSTGLLYFERKAIQSRIHNAIKHYIDPNERALFIHYLLKYLSTQYLITVQHLPSKAERLKKAQSALSIHIGFYFWEGEGRYYRMSTGQYFNSRSNQEALELWLLYASAKKQAPEISNEMKSAINHIVFEPISVPPYIQADWDDYEQDYERKLKQGY